MDRNNPLLPLANEVEQAFKVWQDHPDDDAYQREYELAKNRLDSEIERCKKISLPKTPH
jgi:hypothetical protein